MLDELDMDGVAVIGEGEIRPAPMAPHQGKVGRADEASRKR